MVTENMVKKQKAACLFFLSNEKMERKNHTKLR